MDSRSMCCMLVVFCLLMTTVKGESPGVSFWGEEITMTCPGDGWSLFNRDVELIEKYAVKYEDNEKVDYSCKKGAETLQFFVKAKVCKNCFEFDGSTALAVFAVDIAVTGLVIVGIYKCAKRRASAGFTSKATPNPKGHGPPPIPSPDYEKLNPRTRSQETYSAVNRMG